MSTLIKLRKGLNIPLQGEAPTVLEKTPQASYISLKPTDFKGLTPKLLLKEGAEVIAGTPVMADKYRPEVLFTSPITGTVSAIIRGEKRKLLEIRIMPSGQNEFQSFTTGTAGSLSKEQIIETLLLSGCWPFIKQRPYGIIANPQDHPKAIFISAFDTAPLAPNIEFILKGQEADFQRGIDVLQKLVPQDQVHVSIGSAGNNAIQQIKNSNLHTFEGPHPAGNVGVQIHHIRPIAKGDMVWTIDPQAVITVGKLFATGKLDATRMIAVTGSQAQKPCYVKVMQGTPVSHLPGIGAQNPKTRYISGNCLTGDNVGYEGTLGFYHTQVTLLPEGDYYEFFGWANPFRFKKFSVSHTYFSWLFPKKKYALDTNLNGGERAFVMPNVYGKVLPMDILPTYLLKAILAQDIDRMEALGIYEVIEEDFALCEFVCPSKLEIQDMIAKGIDLMIKEM